MIVRTAMHYFDLTRPENESLAGLNVANHPAMVVVSGPVSYGLPVRAAKAPDSLSVALSGFSIVAQPAGSYGSVRLKLGVAGSQIYGGPGDGPDCAPTADHFQVVVCVDNGCQIDSLQVVWTAIWND